MRNWQFFLSLIFFIYRLLYKVLDKCTLKFNAVKQAIGVGLYKDSVYVDMRTNFHMMEESVDYVPEGVDKETLANQLEDRYKLVKGKSQFFVVGQENATFTIN